jgi:hypothetical protein
MFIEDNVIDARLIVLPDPPSKMRKRAGKESAFLPREGR